MSRIVCIIQARMGSTRLPGKVLLPLLDEPVLAHVLERVSRARTLDDVVVATTTLEQDDAIVDFCTTNGWASFRGSEQDVLDRYYQAAVTASADTIVRVTSDCPLIDPVVLDYTISGHLAAAPPPDYTSNSTIRRYPRGLDVEVFSFAALEKCWQTATLQPEREHVTYHMYQRPETYQLHRVTNPVDYSHHRWTVDTPEDLKLIRHIFDYFGHNNFSWQETLQAFDVHPEWKMFNAHIQQKKV